MSLEERFLDIQHRCNPLHVFCRLVDRGFSKKTSKRACRCYEILIYWAISFFSIAGIFLCKTVRRLSPVVSMFLIFFLLTTTLACAGSNVTLAWDPNTEADLAGYRLYQSATSGQYEFGPDHCVATIPAGTETVTLEDVADGTWYFVMTAYDNFGNESKRSNEVMITLDSTPPAPPQNFIITLVKKLLAWFGGFFGRTCLV